MSTKKTRVCARKACGRTFTRGQGAARFFAGRGRQIFNSKYCCTECREVARVGRRGYEERKAIGLYGSRPGEEPRG